MTNGHPYRVWNRHVCFDIFCFVLFRYIRFAKLHSFPVFVYISFCFVPFRFVSVNFAMFHFVSFRFGIFRFAFHFAFYRSTVVLFCFSCYYLPWLTDAILLPFYRTCRCPGKSKKKTCNETTGTKLGIENIFFFLRKLYTSYQKLCCGKKKNPLALISDILLSSQYMFSYHPFYFDFHSARVIFDVSSDFYFWNVNRTPTNLVEIRIPKKFSICSSWQDEE